PPIGIERGRIFFHERQLKPAMRIRKLRRHGLNATGRRKRRHRRSNCHYRSSTCRRSARQPLSPRQQERQLVHGWASREKMFGTMIKDVEKNRKNGKNGQ